MLSTFFRLGLLGVFEASQFFPTVGLLDMPGFSHVLYKLCQGPIKDAISRGEKIIGFCH